MSAKVVDMIPSDPETILSRREAAAALTEAGFKTAEASLATFATRGGGPPFRHFGPKAIYTWGDLLAWARARVTPPKRSTSDVASTPPQPRTRPRNRPGKAPEPQPAA